MNMDLQTCVVQCPNMHCTTSECVKQLFEDATSGQNCINCRGEMNRVTHFDILPKALVLPAQNSLVNVSKSLRDPGSGTEMTWWFAI